MKDSMPRIRFLPVTIFAAALLLTVKMGSIWEGFEGIVDGAILVAGARAQQAPAAAPAAPVAAGEEAAPALSPRAASVADSARRLVAEDPTLLTQEEIDLLQQLATRRTQLDARERELETRVGMLRAAEARIDRKVTELKDLQGAIEKLIGQHGEQEDLKFRSMVKIYENMKPKDAARIFEDLDLEVLLTVAERMKERKLAPIMAQMNPEKAREITVELTRSRQLPLPGANTGG